MSTPSSENPNPIPEALPEPPLELHPVEPFEFYGDERRRRDDRLGIGYPGISVLFNEETVREMHQE